MKLTDEQKNLLNLCARSKKDEDGWSIVGDMLWDYIQTCTKDCELFELGDHVIRISDKGKIVLQYLV